MTHITQTRKHAIAVVLSLVVVFPGTAGAQRINTIIAGKAAETVRIEGVVKDQFDHPLGAAEVRVASGGSAISNSRGEFTILDIPAGTIVFTSRRIGYKPTATQIEVQGGAIVHLAVTLVPVAIQLGTIVIDGKRLSKALWQTGFYQRRDTGLGSYFDSDYMAHWHSGMANLAAAVPTVQVARKSNGIGVAQARLPSGVTCDLNVFIDGHLIPWATTTGFDAIIRPEDVIGVEVYPTAAEIPSTIVGKGGTQGVGTLGTVSLRSEMTAADNSTVNATIGGGYVECGAMLIWTKPFETNRK